VENEFLLQQDFIFKSFKVFVFFFFFLYYYFMDNFDECQFVGFADSQYVHDNDAIHSSRKATLVPATVEMADEADIDGDEHDDVDDDDDATTIATAATQPMSQTDPLATLESDVPATPPEAPTTASSMAMKRSGSDALDATPRAKRRRSNDTTRSLAAATALDATAAQHTSMPPPPRSLATSLDSAPLDSQLSALVERLDEHQSLTLTELVRLNALSTQLSNCIASRLEKMMGLPHRQ
jgi:hypothetical protein